MIITIFVNYPGYRISYVLYVPPNPIFLITPILLKVQHCKSGFLGTYLLYFSRNAYLSTYY